MFYLNIDKL